MDFGLSDEQRQLQSVFRDFLVKEYPAQMRREVFEGEQGYDPRLWGDRTFKLHSDITSEYGRYAKYPGGAP